MKLKRIVGGLILMAAFFACEVIEDVKDSVEDLQNMDKAAEAIGDFSSAAKEFSQVNIAGSAYAVEAEAEVKTSLKSSSNISIVPFDASTFPKTVIIDFGEGTVGIDGITRSGKMHIILENGWGTQVGNKQQISLVDYYQDNVQVKGTYKSERTENVGTYPTYTVSLNDGEIIKPSGQAILYQQNTVRTQVQGSDTPLDPADDAYEIAGTQNGVSAKGYAYRFTATNSNPLFYALDCRYIRSGKLDVVVEGIEFVLDYGIKEETCMEDNTATLIYRSIEKEVTL